MVPNDSSSYHWRSFAHLRHDNAIYSLDILKIDAELDLFYWYDLQVFGVLVIYAC